MAWIKVIFPDEAEGELKEVYEQIGQQRGAVPGANRVVSPPALHSLNPKAMWHAADG